MDPKASNTILITGESPVIAKLLSVTGRDFPDASCHGSTGGGGFLGNQLAKALLESNINIKELVLSDIVPPRDIYGFENDKRITKVTSDVSRPEAVDELFSGRQYTAIAAFHGLM